MTTIWVRVPRRAALLAPALTVLLSIATSASSARFFQAATQTDFLRGEVQSLSIDSRGQLMIGPATELVYETAAPFLWALTPASDGSIFIGTGNEGRVYKVGADGRGALFFDAAELEAHALAAAPDGGLYVGTSPDGRIYKVDRNGNATTFFEPGEKYIWALATDARGNVYAATGEKGAVYRIAPDGKGARFYQARATNATALAVDREGRLLVGTESPGRVIRVDADGKGFILLDSPYQEISALRFDGRGNLYVAAVNGTPGSTPASAPPSEPGGAGGGDAPIPVVSVSTEITSIAIVDDPGGSGTTSPAPREDRRSIKGAIYRIAPDGLWEQLWDSREDSPYDLVIDDQNRLIVGTGSKGKIFRLDGDPLRPTLLSSADAQQVTALHRDGSGRLLYATANPGKLFRLSSSRATRGTYESDVRDAQIVATWGMLSWRGTAPRGTAIQLFTRAGNTETPDDTWSGWSSPHTVAEGSPITSPNARYLQWRAELTGKGDETPILTSVTAAYLQRNLRPRVRSVTVHPSGIVFQKPFTTGEPDLAGFENQTTPDRELTMAAMTPQGGSGSPSLGRRTYQKGLQTLIWRADDENGDRLSYDVLYRREGETTWKALRRDLGEPILVWDTATVPNGTYFVRIVASDSPSNPAAHALAGEQDSQAFEVDNTRPQIAVAGARVVDGRTVVAFEVADDHSPIQRVEYSQDGQQWRSVFPTDGIADSRQERYELAVEGTVGPRGITLRATDSMNNVSTAQVEPPQR